MSENGSPASTEFEFDLKLFRLSAIKKAAYRFAGPFSVELEQVSDSLVRVKLTQRQSPGQLDSSCLPNEVLDQELRETVAEETKSVRDLLLAQAFSGLSLVDPVGESADYHDDPLVIAARQMTPGAAANGGA